MSGVTALTHTAFRETVQQFAERGNDNERVLASLLLGVYDRSCEMPRVVTYINEWSLGALNEH